MRTSRRSGGPLIARQIFDAIRTLNRQDGLTVLIVEQNANHALKLAHRGYVMVHSVAVVVGPRSPGGVM